MRYLIEDLYNLHPGKWIVTVNEEWNQSGVFKAELFGVYDTEREALNACKDLDSCGIKKMIREDEELEFIFVNTGE